MAYDGLEYVRLACEFLSLAGGDVWARVEAAAWQQLELERSRAADKQREVRSKQHGRFYHRMYERDRRARNKAVVSRVRSCKQCRRMFTLSETQIADGRRRARAGRFCTPSCFGKWNRARVPPPRPTRMVTIDGVTRSLPVWAKHYGLTVGLVYRRKRGGMSDVEALTTPKRTRPGFQPSCSGACLVA
jgi:hypothetical protein